jgi:hypothetical protein
MADGGGDSRWKSRCELRRFESEMQGWLRVRGGWPVDEQRSSQADACRLPPSLFLPLLSSPLTFTRGRGKGLAW